jgi:hypothetical protein
MGNKSKVKTRKGQLIHTFGTGAMQINKDGVSMITCGLDHWFESDNTQNILDDSTIKKFELSDERLQKKLGVKSFRVPPDFKVLEDGRPNRVPIPAKRFPLWHICSNTRCQALSIPYEGANSEQKLFCHKCKAPAFQSRFISLCADGHINDFPWFDWLNHHTKGSCSIDKCQLRLEGTGSSSVSNIRVKCETCNTRAVSLKGIFQSEPNEQGVLESTLSKAGISCNCNSPWLGESVSGCCSKVPVAALRQSTNVYFSKTDSSIHIPFQGNGIYIDIHESFEELTEPQKSRVNGAGEISVKVQILGGILNGKYTDKSLIDYFELKEKGIEDLDCETEEEYRSQERKFFLEGINETTLSVQPQKIDVYQEWISKYISHISLVKKLTVTQTMYGFDRISPATNKTTDEYKKMLWAESSNIDKWLPAVQSHGEGIYIEFDADSIQKWSEEHAKTTTFINLMNKKEEHGYLDKFEELTPEFLLIHSFSHLLINQLIYESGYSTASLRERLYVSNKDNRKMFGLLIYTASGDSEGSLGGLVRIGQPGKLEPIIVKAISNASWCSSDPICYETGHHGGQGPNGLNLAACHNCLLLPETSCEVFNSLLDRMTINATISELTGFFDQV